MDHNYQQVKILSEHISIIVKKYPLFSGILELNMMCIQYMRAYDQNKLDLLPSLISKIEPIVNPYVENVIQRYDTVSKEIENKCLLYKTKLYNSEHYNLFLKKIDIYYRAIHKYKDYKDLTALMDMDVAIEDIKNVLLVSCIHPTQSFVRTFDGFI